MRRVLVPASVVVLVLTACGAGQHASALRGTPVSKTAARVSAPQPSLKAIAAARERAAVREAKALLPRFGPREQVPHGTVEVALSAPKISRRVTDPALVAKIVRWIDALPVAPDVTISCSLLFPAPRIELVFRSATGTRLASASTRSGDAG